MYEKREAAKRGKPASLTKKPEVTKPPISKYWIGRVPSLIKADFVAALLFVLVGGAVFELIRLFF